MKYLTETKRLLRGNVGSKKGDVAVISLPQMKRGRPLLLGENLDNQVRSYIKAVHEKQGVINTAIIIACAEAIVRKMDKNLLKENAGPIEPIKPWTKSLLHQINCVKRKATTSAKVETSHFIELKEQFYYTLKLSLKWKMSII